MPTIAPTQRSPGSWLTPNYGSSTDKTTVSLICNVALSDHGVASSVDTWRLWLRDWLGWLKAVLRHLVDKARVHNFDIGVRGSKANHEISFAEAV